MSDSVRPHRRQPTRLTHPWDSPGKNTGVGCHFLLQICNPMEPARLLCPWNSPGKNTGVGSHSLVQGIFSTQGSNLGRLHCRRTLYQLSYQGSPNSGMPTNKCKSNGEITGNGTLLQCSCLENPRDGGAWLAAVYGVSQSQTRLK